MTLREVRALDHAYVFVAGRGDDPSAAGRARTAPGTSRSGRSESFGVATLDEALEASRGAFVNLDLERRRAVEVPPGTRRRSPKAIIATARPDRTK